MSAENPLPKYRHYKPKNLAVVRIDGRDHYLGRYDSPESWEMYHRLLAEQVVKGTVTSPVKQDGPTGADDLTLNELLLAYWRHAETYYVKDSEPTSEVDSIRQALGPVRELYDHTLARNFGPLALKACQEAMIARGWARTFINR
jgi:hypothetical protein